MTAIDLTVKFTTAGLAAVAAAHGLGVAAKITELAVGDANGEGYEPSAAAVALENELVRVELFAGGSTAPQQVMMQAEVPAAEAPEEEFFIREVGFFLEDGTLLCVWSDPDLVLGYLGQLVPWHFRYILAWEGLPAGSIEVVFDGDAAYAVLSNDVAQLDAKVRYTIEQNDLEYAAGDDTQLWEAIRRMIAAGAHSVVIANATFADGIEDEDAVHWDAAEAEFALALGDGSPASNMVGIADVTNAQVFAFGETRDGLMSGLTPGRVWLDGTTPGALATDRPAFGVKVGIAKSATVLFVDVDEIGELPLTQGRRMFYFDASALRPTESGGGDPIEGAETTAGRPDVVGVALDFATETAFQFSWVLPPSVDPESLTFRFRVAEADAGATQHTTRLGIQAVAVGHDGTMDVAYGDPEEVTVDLGTLEDTYRSDETDPLTIAGDPAEGDLVFFRVFRNHDHEADDLDVRALIQGIECYADVVAGNDA